MGKRSNFERKERDFYPTPYKAVEPLLRHLPNNSTFIEPCAGDGRLIKHIEKHNHKCNFACDIEPQRTEGLNIEINQVDALFFGYELPKADFIITNPPWDRKILHPMIDAFRVQAPTWLLFDTDWIHTVQSIPYIKYCSKIVSIGRVSWLDDGKCGKDNSAWYLFGKDETKTEFIGR